MTQTVAQFRDKFALDQLTVFRNGGWTVSLRPAACTLGACVISANRPHTSLAGIDATEAAEFVEAVAWFEERVGALFLPTKFNYLALMMVDDQLHFHALPRYAAAPRFAGIDWPDRGWPGQPDLGGPPDGAEAARDAVLAALASADRA